MATLLLLAATAAFSNVYDLTFPKYISQCPNGCADWTNVQSPNYNQSFINGTFIDIAAAQPGTMCAMPGASAGDHECDCSDKSEVITDSFAGPWCVCKDPGSDGPFAAYCTPPQSVPEQINLQLAAPNVSVVSFVTYEKMPSAAPSAVVSLNADLSEPINLEGIAHELDVNGTNRTYIFNFIKFAGLKERTVYYYKVKSGTSVYSDVFSFRTTYSTGITRIATYGDMGHSHYNCMGNLKAECKAGSIDAILHMGDHCYNFGMANLARGDAYMNAYQPTIAECVWMPVIGNHEASDGDHFGRYEAMAMGEVSFPTIKSSTATTPLGHLLTKGTLFSAGHYGSTPSGTSRYVSSDLGLIHLVGLDLNNFDPDQMAWLEKDLAAANANRENVPWIMVTSHFPLHYSKFEENKGASAEYYLGDEAESFSTSGHDFVACEDVSCNQTFGDFQSRLTTLLDPILFKYGVDVYNAGHVHDYESTWPICDVNGSYVACQENYTNPKGPVHITEGNGGVPGVVGQNSLSSCVAAGSFCRMKGTGGAYGRITAFNATHLQYEHVENPTGDTTDTFMIVQTNHGPFRL
eukprot:m.342179 g.342179  ORF g.342179 m.342179 type:complete len:577 (+) comp21074_c0_seq1:121-1851(+)